MTRSITGYSVVVWLGIVIAADVATAQVVNIEAKRRDERVEGVSGSTQMNFMYRAGNVKRFDLGLNSLLQWVKARHIMIGMVGLEYAKSRSRNQSGYRSVENERFIHIRYNYTLTSWLLSDLFYQRQENEFIDLDSRNLIGIGPRFRLLRTASDACYIGTTCMFEREHLRPPHPDGSTSTARWNSYLALQWGRWKKLTLTQTLYLQPRFTRLGDFRLLDETAVLISLSTWLSLHITYSMRYDSTPPDSVVRSDQRITQGLTFRY